MTYQNSQIPSPKITAIGMLRAAWPKFTDEQARLYLLMTKDIPEPILVKAIEALIKESAFLPAVAEIRSRAEAFTRPPRARSLLTPAGDGEKW